MHMSTADHTSILIFSHMSSPVCLSSVICNVRVPYSAVFLISITAPLTSLCKHYRLCNTLLDDFILYISVHQVTYCIVLYCDHDKVLYNYNYLHLISRCWAHCKTELIWTCSRHNPSSLGGCNPSLQLGDDVIKPSRYVWLLGVPIAADLGLDRHVSNVCKTCFFSGCLQLLEILEILEISWIFVDAPGKIYNHIIFC